VTVSYFEWVQNIENEKWTEAEVNSKLKVKMEHATDTVLDKQREINSQIEKGALRGKDGIALEPVDLRTAALVLAVERIANVALERGIWP
jgi:glutamate dehydrogenase (NAD(P)+)